MLELIQVMQKKSYDTDYEVSKIETLVNLKKKNKTKQNKKELGDEIKN